MKGLTRLECLYRGRHRWQVSSLRAFLVPIGVCEYVEVEIEDGKVAAAIEEGYEIETPKKQRKFLSHVSAQIIT